MTDIQKRLFEMADEKYAAFQVKLNPAVAPESIIGVRLPRLRVLAKEIWKNGSADEFFAELPHKYFDENMLHGLVINEIKDYKRCVSEVERFLPYVDNWATCDSTRPKIFAKHKSEILPVAIEWSKSKETYTCRYGIEVLMDHFLDVDFKPEYNEIPAAVQSDEYYVKMMVAWYFATALAKQWDDTIPYIEKRRLPDWIHKKAIQKAIESYRITPEHKEYLRSLK